MSFTTRQGNGRKVIVAAVAVAVLALAGGSLAQAAEVTLVPIGDTTIYQGVDVGSGENFEDNSCGAGTGFFAGVTNDGLLRRALLRFDVAAAVPAGSEITRVTLTLNVNRAGDNQDAFMELSSAHPRLG